MITRSTLRVLIASGLAGLSCYGLPEIEVPDGIRAAVYACSGGMERASQTALAAEFERRRGGLILESEVSERGADLFAFGEYRGADGVEMYNAFTACVIRLGGNLEGTACASGVEPDSLNQVGSTPYDEPILQCPPPGQVRAGDEVWLSVHTGRAQRWAGEGTPYWRIQCGTGRLPRIHGSQEYWALRFVAPEEVACTAELESRGPVPPNQIVPSYSLLWNRTIRVQIE